MVDPVAHVMLSHTSQNGVYMTAAIATHYNNVLWGEKKTDIDYFHKLTYLMGSKM